MKNSEHPGKENATPPSKVWFACHPDDFEKYFEEISKEILLVHNCKFYHSKNTQWTSEQDFYFALQQMQVMVIPVSMKLLTSHNFALDAEFPFARQEGIPVLPILVESGLDQLYSQKFGRLQYLDRITDDSTTVPYLIKLRNFLNTILPSPVQIKAIQDAFDAHIFLSYRKKDRYWANQLMRLIHQNDFCRDIAIFYDEFLNPGEDFEQAIEEKLIHSDLFVMAITPNITKSTTDAQGRENENYIVKKEYPMAKKEGKPILPAELVPTKQKKLLTAFKDIPPCVKIDQADSSTKELTLELRKGLQGIALRQHTSPEHDFFIGLAYMNGISVEVDRRRGVQMITEAAMSGVQEAEACLTMLYWAETGISKDYLSKTLRLEKSLLSMSCEKRYDLKRFFLLCEIAEGYAGLSNPYEKPAFTIETAVNRAVDYLTEAIELGKTLKQSEAVRRKLCYAYINLSALLTDNMQKLLACSQSVAIAERLAQRTNSIDSLRLLSEMLQYSISASESILGATDKHSVRKNKEKKKNYEFYRETLFRYVEVLTALYERDASSLNVRRCVDALCKSAELYSREKNREMAVHCYLTCVDLGRKHCDSRIVRCGAIHLADIYAREGKAELVQKYMNFVLNP